MLRDQTPSPSLSRLAPLARVGGGALAVLRYLGELALLGVAAARALFQSEPGAPRWRVGLTRQCDWLFGVGLPLVGLVHVGMGSFLAMQAQQGATFVEAVGPVVGVGLCRNVASLLSGLTLAGILAARGVPDLRRPSHLGLDDDPDWLPNRAVARGQEPDPRTPPSPARLTATRMLAAALAGPILGVWGTAVGTATGWLVATELMGIPTPIFFAKLFEMLWLRDAVGLLVKGVAFGLAAALIVCHEGLRGPRDPRAVPTAAARAAGVAAAVILLLNSTWYTLMYMAGPAFGPTILKPPVR
jgi:phospholipid/cholesterol/gamma-HCH transport system permease protein